MTEIEQSLQSLRDIYVNYPKQLTSATEELNKIEDEIQDINHVIELCAVDAIGMTKLYKELKKLRQRRREIKNEIELLEQVKEIINFQKPTEKIINNIIGKVRITLQKQDTRKYRLRVRKDLQYLLDKY